MNDDIKVIIYNESVRLSDGQIQSLNYQLAKWKKFDIPKSSVAVQNRCQTAINLFKEAIDYKRGEDYGDIFSHGRLCYKSLRLYQSNRGIESGIYYDIDKDSKTLNIVGLFSAPWNQDKFETRIQGMAKRMLYDVFKIALSKGCNKVKVNAVPYSGSFYTGLGFTKGKKNEDGRDMLLRLKGMEDFVEEYAEKERQKEQTIHVDFNSKSRKSEGYPKAKYKIKNHLSLVGIK